MKLSENKVVAYNKLITIVRGEIMGKAVIDNNLYPTYQNTQDERLIDRKEEYMEELEKAKITGQLLNFAVLSEELSE